MMPSQNVLVEDYKKLQLQFLICDSCYWCATSLSHGIDKCPCCGSTLGAMRLPLTIRRNTA